MSVILDNVEGDKVEGDKVEGDKVEGDKDLRRRQLSQSCSDKRLLNSKPLTILSSSAKRHVSHV
jgi:hypothetical protein